MEFYLATYEAELKFKYLCRKIFDRFYSTTRYYTNFHMVASRGDTVFRIRFITCSYKLKLESGNGPYVVDLCHKRSKSEKARFDADSCDYLFIETGENCYLIPVIQVRQKRALTLNESFNEYIIKEK